MVVRAGTCVGCIDAMLVDTPCKWMWSWVLSKEAGRHHGVHGMCCIAFQLPAPPVTTCKHHGAAALEVPGSKSFS